MNTYINHLSTGAFQDHPRSWMEFLKDIGPEVLSMYPVQQQRGADCFAYAPKIAITLQTGTSPDSTCFKNYDGGEPDVAAKYYAKQGYNDYKNLSSEFGITYSTVKGKRSANPVLCRSAKRDAIKTKMLEYLRDGALVVGIQHCGYPEWHKDHVRFTYNDNGDAHAVCIIGYYVDDVLGPCFVSKCSNKPILPTSGKFMKKKLIVGEKKLDPKLFSIALLPLKDWLCNSNQTNYKTLQAIDGVMLYPLPALDQRLKVRKKIIEQEKERKKQEKIRLRNERSRTTRTTRRSRRVLKF